MQRFSTPAVISLTASAVLALVLSACGGDAGSDSAASAAPQPGDTSPAPAQQASVRTGTTAFTVPDWTTFAMEISAGADGKEMLVLPDPTLGTQQAAIQQRDAKGNITQLGDGPFKYITSLLGNRVGMLCGLRHVFKKTDDPRFDFSTGHYIYLSNEFTEVDYRELFDRKFNVIDDCDLNPHSYIDNQGRIVHFNEDDPTPGDITPLFAPQGYKEDASAGVITRAKAYKGVVDGKDTYVMIAVTALDPEVPGTDPAEQALVLAVSQ